MPRPPFMPSWQMAEGPSGPKGPPGEQGPPGSAFAFGIYTPEDFDAVGDGDADDTAACQAAEDAAHAAGGGWVFYGQRYKWSGELRFRGGVRRSCAGRRRAPIVEDALDRGLVAGDGTAFIRYGQWGGGNSEDDNPGPLECMVIDGANVGGVTAGALVIMECVDGVIRDCNIIRSAADVVQVGSSQNSLIDDSFIGLAPNGTALRFKADHAGEVKQGAGQIKVTNTYLATSRYLFRIQGNDPANFHFPPHDIVFDKVLCENYTAGNDVGVISAGTNLVLRNVVGTVSQGSGPPPNDCVLLISQTEIPTWATTVELDSCLWSGGTQATKPTAGVIIDSTGGVGCHVHFTGRHSFQNVQACIAPKGAATASVIMNTATAYRTQDGVQIPWYTTALGGSLFGTYTEWGTPLRFVMGGETGLQPPIQTRRQGDAQDRYRQDRDGRQEWRNGVDTTTRGAKYYDEANDLMALGRTWRFENAWALRPLVTNVTLVDEAVTVSASGTGSPVRRVVFLANNATANITLNDGVDGSQFQFVLSATITTGNAVTWPSNIVGAPQPIAGQVVTVVLEKFGTTWYAKGNHADVGLAAHLADSSDAHDASAISYAGSAGLSSPDVEGALDELDTEKAAVAAIDGLAAAALNDDTSDTYAAMVAGFARGQVVTHPRWGADKTGATDSTTAIQNCINFVGQKGVVYFPAGTYLYSILAIPQGDGLSLVGDNRGGTVLKLAAGKAWDTTPSIATSSTGAPVRGTKNLLIEHITFDGNAAGRTEPPRWLQTPAGVPITDPEEDYFANGGKINDPAHAANATAVAASQSLGGAGNLTLTANPYTPNSVRKITITSAGNDSGLTWTVTGTDINDAALVSNVTGANAGTATTSVVFKTVTQIASTGATASTVTAGVAAFDIFGTVAEGRRNPGYGNTFPLLRLNLCEKSAVRNCQFLNHKGYGVLEAGGRDVDIAHNYFEDVGKDDGPFMAIWTQSFGTPGGGHAFYQDSENIRVRDNVARNLERGFCLFAATKGGKVTGNLVDGAGEFGLYLPTNLHYSGGTTEVAHNTLRNIRITDIASSGIECEHPIDTWIHDNDIEGTDQYAMIITGARRTRVSGNHLKNCYATHVLPYGPFSERYGFNVGLAPIAGDTLNVADGGYFSIGTLNGIGCNKLTIDRNLIHEDRASFPAVFKQNKSGGNSLASDCVIEGNVLDVPAAMTFLNKSLTAVWAANMPLSIRNNTGHASESPVIVTKQFAAGETGTFTVACGFRPRLVRVYVAANNAALGQQASGEFSWNRAAARNDFVQRSASVSGTGQSVALEANVTVKMTDAAGTNTFLSGAPTWTEDGFTINPTTVTNITNARFVCEP